MLHTDSLMDAISRLKESPKFRGWRLPLPEIGESHISIAEKHYSPDELAEMWGVSTETIRSIFREEPGVLKIGKTGAKYRRGYVTLRIPESVAERIHQRLSA